MTNMHMATLLFLLTLFSIVFFLCGLTRYFNLKAPKVGIVGGACCKALLVSGVVWSWETYPDVTPRTVLTHDYGTIVSITPSDRIGPTVVETTEGTTLRIYPQFPLSSGDTIAHYTRYKKNSAESYFLINGRRLPLSLLTWNKRGWSFDMKFHLVSDSE